MASNAKPFTVTVPPVVTNASPLSAIPGQQVTIIGSGFGSTQGLGSVWLDDTFGTVVSWSDTQVVATVSLQARSGTAKVLQSGLWSNEVPLDVKTVTITAVSPTQAPTGFVVAIDGYGFGDIQGAGSVQLGSTMAGQILTWSETHIEARVAASAVSGVAKVRRNGIWSNDVTFTVLGAGPNSVILAPSLMNMVVGETRSIQALDSSSHAVIGLGWTSSDPTIVSLSTDDPPVLTALAAGHVTITAGAASADVNVSADALPVGTVLWSNPGNGSGVYSIVPAVPSPTGVADVFAFQYDGTVQAITSDGLTAWTADVSDGYPVPDFQGGLVLITSDQQSIVKVDGLTGQRRIVYSTSDDWESITSYIPHPDGTIFALVCGHADDPWLPNCAVIGVDPATGAQKFSVSMPVDDQWNRFGDLMISGDGYAYLPLLVGSWADDSHIKAEGHLKILRVDANGASDLIPVYDWLGLGVWNEGLSDLRIQPIANGDRGVVFTWDAPEELGTSKPKMAITNGTSVTVVDGPQISGVDGPVTPVLQAQDGSFVGTLGDSYMVAFDATGTVRWSVPNYDPRIATADGGVIATDAAGAAVMFDQTGSVAGQVASLPTYSWPGYAYQIGSIDQFVSVPIYVALTFWAFQGGNQAHTAAAELQQKFPPLRGGSCGASLGPRDMLWNALQDLSNQLRTDTACSTAAQQSVFGKLKDTKNQPVTTSSFLGYINNKTSFYDGTVSTLDYRYAKCGENLFRFNCNGNGLTVKGTFEDTSGTTAITITPSSPFKSFWKPGYKPPGPDDNGFGIGINPNNRGANIFNESILIHEALHGMTALYEDELQGMIGTGNQPLSISIFIKTNILSACPSFR